MWNESHDTDRMFIELADNDATWGPFPFLRPKTTECLGLGRILAMSALLGVPQGLVANLGLAWARQFAAIATVPVYVVPITLTACLALLLHLSLGRAWNRRVQRQQRARAWLEATERPPCEYRKPR